MLEPDRLKLKLTKEEENSLTQPLIALGTDLLNNEDVSKEDVIKLYLYSQQNLRLIMDRIERSRDNKSVSLQPETLKKLHKFMDTSRKHPLAGGARFKSEDEALSFLLDLGLKFGFKFLESMLNNDNFQSVTGSMKPEKFDDSEERKKQVSKEFEENAD
jgi:hypothetical protein